MSGRVRVCLFAALSCLYLSAHVHAKSVYTISRHTNSTLTVHDIDANGLLESRYTGLLPNNGSGAIDLAVNTRDNVIFSSYDGANVIEALSTKTMEAIGSLTLSGGTENEIAGLEYCYTHNLLLGAERYDTCIRVLKFDLNQQIFTKNIEIEMPFVYTGGILGLTLDERDENDIKLYISQSDPSTVVRCYQFKVKGEQITVTHQKDIPIEWEGESKIAVGVSVYNNGSGQRYLYSSGYNHENPNEHPYLIQTVLTPSNQVIGRLAIPVDPYTYVAGVDTDNETGLLYLTTLGGHSSIRVYDPNQWTSDPNDCLPLQSLTGQDIGGPAGISIGPNLYGPDRLMIQKTQIAPEPNNCINPNTFVTYRTAFHQGVEEDEFNIVLRETMPEESIFVSADPNTGWYDSASHTYIWEVGDLAALDPNEPGDPNHYYELTVFVTDTAEPGGFITNSAEIESQDAYAKASVHTAICCWLPDEPIFVDKSASGHNSGVDWDNAYTTLSRALDRVKTGCGSEIWVAEGVYSPGNAVTDTFTIPDGVRLYGGFAGTETERDRRNWKTHPTVLTGYIDMDIHGNDVKSRTIVTMGGDTLLDGFTLEAGELYGIDGMAADVAVRNCVFKENGTAVNARDGNLTVEWCDILNSQLQGICHVSDSNSIQATITHCRIFDNMQEGIYIRNADVLIADSLIYRNGLAGTLQHPYGGLFLKDLHPGSLLRNNTIVSNRDAGIRSSGDPAPTVLNCIVWDNTGRQLTGFNPDSSAFNSCIQDCNDVNFNISLDPQFAYDPFNASHDNFHLAYDSPCVDPNVPPDFWTADPNAFDLDGETRFYGAAVDIGADEAVACDGELSANDIYHPLDENADGILNFDELMMLSETWLCRDPNDPAIITDPNDTSDPNYVSPAQIERWRQSWNPQANIEPGGDSLYWIDLADLELFWNDYWLWLACWRQPEYLDAIRGP